MSLSLVYSISDSQTEIAVTGGIENVQAGGTIQIESELIKFGNASVDGFLNLTRGYGGTSAVAHLANKLVTLIDTTPTTNVVIAYNDNATSLRVKGPQDPSEGGANVQSYSGIFYADSYDTAGILKTRFITGGNLEMDVELQSPHQLRLTANDGTQTDPEIWMSSQNNIKINTRNDSEGISSKQFLIDRVDTSTVGSGNTSDVNLDVSAGNLCLLSGNTTGAAAVNSLTSTQRDALTKVVGMIIWNSSTGHFEGWNGSTWSQLDN